MAENKEKSEGKIVKVAQKVTVYATGSGRGYIKKGEEISVHPLLAAKLVATGKATEKAQK